MYTLHIANKKYSSWSLRPWILLKALNIPFNEIMTPFAKDKPSRLNFIRFSPSGQVPCLIDGDLTVWDSLAIVEYIAEKQPQVWPSSVATRAWARSASAEMHAGFRTLIHDCPMNCCLQKALESPSEGLMRDIDRLNTLLAEGIHTFGGPFLAGEAFTAVDAFYAPVVFRISSYDLPVNTTVTQYVRHMLAFEPMMAWKKGAEMEIN